MILVDTNVLVDIWENDPDWADGSILQLRAQSQIHPLSINPVTYAELSLTFKTVEALDRTISDMDLQIIEIPRAALFLAGKASSLIKMGLIAQTDPGKPNSGLQRYEATAAGIKTLKDNHQR